VFAKFIFCHLVLLFAEEPSWTERIARKPSIIRTTPPIKSANATKSKLPAIILEVPTAPSSTPTKNITEPK
jgi:hypothetical protein